MSHKNGMNSVLIGGERNKRQKQLFIAGNCGRAVNVKIVNLKRGACP